MGGTSTARRAALGLLLLSGVLSCSLLLVGARTQRPAGGQSAQGQPIYVSFNVQLSDRQSGKSRLHTSTR